MEGFFNYLNSSGFRHTTTAAPAFFLSPKSLPLIQVKTPLWLGSGCRPNITSSKCARLQIFLYGVYLNTGLLEQQCSNLPALFCWVGRRTAALFLTFQCSWQHGELPIN